MSKRFSERILTYLQRPGYTPIQEARLARAMGIAEAERGDFHDAVDALRRVGRVIMGTNNAVMLPHMPGQVVGTYRANPRGFGFVVPDEPTAHGDLFIPPGDSLDAITGDKVACQVVPRGKREGKKAFGGRITRVIERGESRFVGHLSKEGDVNYVMPDGNTLHCPILIGDPKAKGARAGDQVVVEITQYAREGSPARGVIVERLGQAGRPGVDLLSIIRQYNLPDAFSPEVIDETRKTIRAFDPEAALREREDLSDRTIITIDPDDARDYDDAISLERLGASGNGARTSRNARGARSPSRGAAWELGVHIADVSCFVRAGSTLDVEAQKRGTSVYFPGHVVPMLPEALSNGLCSLQEGEPRLCKSAFIQYDAGGRVVSTRFANTVIHSTKRLTYGDATSILEGGADSGAGRGRQRFANEVVALVKCMDKLARSIRKRRLAEGMLVLELPAVDLILDDQGRVVDARPEDTSFSHTIIEMFMVEANEAVARLLERQDVPFLRRIHPEPDDDSLEAMARFVKAGGMSLPRRIEVKDLQKLLERLRGKKGSYAVNLAVLRSMQMAEYSPKHVGHFALASRSYTHFTSPIRRYADLMIHRLLEEHLGGGRSGKKRGRLGRASAPVSGGDELAEQGRKLSYLSRRAESAERELKALKVLTLLAEQVGDEFDGIVTGVTNFGMFVQHPKYLVDGLLRLEDLGGDWWEVDVKTGRVVGQRSGRSFALGAAVRVRIVSVDLSSRQLNLGLVASEKGVGRKAGPSADSRKSARGGPARRGAERQKGKAGRGRTGQRRR